MHNFIKLLKHELEKVGADMDEAQITPIRHDQDRNVYVMEFKYKNCYWAIHPETDDDRLISAYFYRDKSARVPIMGVSPEYLVDHIALEVKHADRPNYVKKQYGKAIEPTKRVAADESEVSEEQLDTLINELEKDWGDGKMREETNDQMVEPKESEYKKNMVATFPTGEKLELGEKTPVKTNINKQSFKKDSTINWNAETEDEEVATIERDDDGFGKTKLQESLKNTILCYSPEIGAFFAPKHLVEEKNRMKNIHWGFRNGEVVLLREGQKSSGKFTPVCLR